MAEEAPLVCWRCGESTFLVTERTRQITKYLVGKRTMQKGPVLADEKTTVTTVECATCLSEQHGMTYRDGRIVKVEE